MYRAAVRPACSLASMILSDFNVQIAKIPHKTVRDFCLHLFCQCRLVEVRGVEPLSENNFTGCSPGADGHCGRLIRPIPLPRGRPSRRGVR